MLCSLQVQLQLLTATVKLFLKKPTDSVQRMIQLVLSCATNETDNPDLRDRAYVYWRLLSTDPEVRWDRGGGLPGRVAPVRGEPQVNRPAGMPALLSCVLLQCHQRRRCFNMCYVAVCQHATGVTHVCSDIGKVWLGVPCSRASIYHMRMCGHCNHGYVVFVFCKAYARPATT